MTTDLLKRLTEATEGSRELDLAIQIKFGRIYATWNDVPMPEGSTDDTVVPHYTTSLDAAIPGEDIACMEQFWNEDLERFMYRAVTTSQHQAEAWTEALARRAAALKAKDQS